MKKFLYHWICILPALAPRDTKKSSDKLSKFSSTTRSASFPFALSPSPSLPPKKEKKNGEEERRKKKKEATGCLRIWLLISSYHHRTLDLSRQRNLFHPDT